MIRQDSMSRNVINASEWHVAERETNPVLQAIEDELHKS